MAETNESRLLDLEEGADYLHKSKHTARKYVHQRKIPYVRLGREIFFRRKDLENFINGNLVKPLSESKR